MVPAGYPSRPGGSRLAIANDRPPLVGCPGLGPDGAGWGGALGSATQMSPCVVVRYCAETRRLTSGEGAPSDLELRHSLQVLGCSAGGRPPPLRC